ncbi:hypothetical protein QBC46DRAFT_454357 [Diplogelasinospora grovesii]|uniref:Uncharacterized protein n=1 Tax=Diplogelasinospora grovesii TaxID=303347 RepID=A0AAN6MWL1_9PEZI|nr:hypothetical protein QBC46DRAFT_454357 [Diplogelasinospora grovesii]
MSIYNEYCTRAMALATTTTDSTTTGASTTTPTSSSAPTNGASSGSSGGVPSGAIGGIVVGGVVAVVIVALVIGYFTSNRVKSFVNRHFSTPPKTPGDEGAAATTDAKPEQKPQGNLEP